MKRMLIEIDGTTAEVELLEEASPRASAALWACLPITSTITHGRWAGHACTLQAPAFGVDGLEHPVCSIYPGTIVARPESGLLTISYGNSEYRSALGVEYASRVGRLVSNQKALLEVLARMHDEGDKTVVLRRAADD